ncbi:MAG: pitrilysin family protein [Pseudomonadota bacterium]
MKELLLPLACGMLLLCRAHSATGEVGGGGGGWPRLAELVVERGLPNGLKVIMLPNPKAPVISFQVWYRVGERNEELGRTGLSHLLEHMMFKGTKNIGPEQFSRIIQEHGGNNNAFTSADFTACFENMAADEIGTAIDLEADRMANLLLRQEDFETERKVVIEERLLRTEDNPEALLLENLSAAAYKAHPYGWPVIGWLNDIEKLTIDDLRAYHHTYYPVNNAFVVVVGDFDPEAMFSRVERSFGCMDPRPQPPAVRAVEPPQTGERALELKVPARLPTVAWGYHVPNLSEPDGYVLEVIQAILSSGESSRLRMNLVRKGLAVDSSADFSLLSKDPGLFCVVSQVMPGKEAAEVAQAMEKELARLKDEPVGDTELAKAKNQLEAGFIRGQDSLFYQGMLLAMYENTIGWQAVDQYVPAIRKVTARDIQAAAAKWFSADNRTAAILKPLPRGEEPAPEGMNAGHKVMP